MHFYAMSYTAVMEMPIRRFWLFSGNVDRIMAQTDMRTLTTHCSVTDGKLAQKHQDRLVIELGTIQVVEKVFKAPPVEERDQAAFDELKSMM